MRGSPYRHLTFFLAKLTNSTLIVNYAVDRTDLNYARDFSFFEYRIFHRSFPSLPYSDITRRRLRVSLRRSEPNIACIATMAIGRNFCLSPTMICQPLFVRSYRMKVHRIPRVRSVLHIRRNEGALLSSISINSFRSLANSLICPNTPKEVWPLLNQPAKM